MKKIVRICSKNFSKKYKPKQKIDIKCLGNTVVSGFKRINFKSLPVLIVVIALCVGITAGTVAYLTDKGSVVNTFEPSVVKCEVVETVENDVKTVVQIQNTSDIDAYVRVAVIANTIDKDGNITGSADISKNLYNTTDWFKGADGYYYYKLPLTKKDDTVITDITSNLLKADGDGKYINLEDIQVTILAEAIQALGKNDDGKFAVEDAWPVVKVNSSGQLDLAGN